jgi:DNA-binding transcriptional regulator YdaS (Cro superfamily)
MGRMDLKPLPALKSYLAPLDSEQRDQFASRCGTSKGHLQNVMYGVRPCGTDLAVCIERETQLAVRRWDLRPDDWNKHWPELIGATGAPRVPRATKQAA